MNLRRSCLWICVRRGFLGCFVFRRLRRTILGIRSLRRTCLWILDILCFLGLLIESSGTLLNSVLNILNLCTLRSRLRIAGFLFLGRLAVGDMSLSLRIERFHNKTYHFQCKPTRVRIILRTPDTKEPYLAEQNERMRLVVCKLSTTAERFQSA